MSNILGTNIASIYNFTDPREDRKVTWTEGPRLHHSWETQDGQQAVQLPHGHVQRGHHRGDHDTGTFQSQIIVDLKSQTLCQLDRCDTGIKSISDSDRDPAIHL